MDEKFDKAYSYHFMHDIKSQFSSVSFQHVQNQEPVCSKEYSFDFFMKGFHDITSFKSNYSTLFVRRV